MSTSTSPSQDPALFQISDAEWAVLASLAPITALAATLRAMQEQDVTSLAVEIERALSTPDLEQALIFSKHSMIHLGAEALIYRFVAEPIAQILAQTCHDVPIVGNMLTTHATEAALVIAIAIGASVELVQQQTGSGTAEWPDMALNLIGAALMAYVPPMIERWQKQVGVMDLYTINNWLKELASPAAMALEPLIDTYHAWQFEAGVADLLKNPAPMDAWVLLMAKHGAGHER